MRWPMLMICVAVACGPKRPAVPPHIPLLADAPGGDRPARVVAPATADGPLPLVVLLGGYSYLGWELDRWMGLSHRVDEDGFILLIPDGSIDKKGKPFWSATHTCCDWYDAGVDDVAYLRDLIDEVRGRWTVDADRIVVVGHSNGAFMGYRLACEPDVPVTHVVSVAGSSWLDPANCRATDPVSVLQIHGDIDKIMPFEGDKTAPGALDVLARWAARGACADLSDSGARRALVDGDVAIEASIWGHPSCAGDVAVDLWKLQGVDHYPAFTPAFVEAVTSWALDDDGDPSP